LWLRCAAYQWPLCGFLEFAVLRFTRCAGFQGIKAGRQRAWAWRRGILESWNA